jgi:hypothetical protein
MILYYLILKYSVIIVFLDIKTLKGKDINIISKLTIVKKI